MKFPFFTTMSPGNRPTNGIFPASMSSAGMRLYVDGAELGVTALLQDADQVAADEATGAGDDDDIILGH